MSLERFLQAQASAWAGYATALAEIRQGRKASHWIWYIFPQIDGLGRSSTAREYALHDLEEADAYLRHTTLRERYEEIAAAVSGQLARGIPVEELLGGSTDALKLTSSVTLFREAASRLAGEEPQCAGLALRCASILEQIAPQGYPPCSFTLDRIAADRKS